MSPQEGGRTVKAAARPRRLSRSAGRRLSVAALVFLAAASLSLVQRPTASQVTGFALLHSFVHSPEVPDGGVVLDGAGNVYGTSHDGGGHGAGAVFKLKTDGTGFTVLHSFDVTDGSGPYA